MANPMYRQIAEDLRGQIEGGDLEPGRQLRTEIELREHYRASRNTIRDAGQAPHSLGTGRDKAGPGNLRSAENRTARHDPDRQPQGTHPVRRGRRLRRGQTAGRTRVLYSTDPQIEIQKAAASVGRLLQIAEGSQVISRHQKRSIDGTP